MIVEEVMVKKVITIKSDDTLDTAQGLMVENSIRHLPVVNGTELDGILTESDIRSAFLSEIHLNSGAGPSLNPKTMKVRDHMTREPLTVFPETNIEDAALLIYENKIGCLPVVSDNKMVGIVSIMDLLGLFIDMMGIIHSSSRIDVVMGKDPKNFDTVSGIFHDHGINIISVGMSPFNKSKDKRVYLFRLDLCETEPLVKAIEGAGFKVKSAIS
jgi:acetoin utilization protein AcuB